jgi:hypothetical protein
MQNHDFWSWNIGSPALMRCKYSLAQSDDDAFHRML